MFTQKPGTAASGVSHLHSIVTSKDAPEITPSQLAAQAIEDHTVPSGPPLAMEEPTPRLTGSRYTGFWIALAFVVAALIAWRVT